MIWGGAFNSENFRAGFEAVPSRYREAGSALGFSPRGTFLNVTLPIGGRIALPSSINTYICVVKNTSLMYVIGYEELTTTALNISAQSLETLEAFTVLASSTCLSSGRSRPGSACSRHGLRSRRSGRMPDWVEPVARYILEVGLPATLRVSRDRGRWQRGDRRPARDVDHDRLRADASAPIRLYIEVFRGLPILVTVFIVYFGLPSISGALKFAPLTGASIGLILWGSAQVAEATRGAVNSIPHEQHEAAAALGFGWTGRHAVGHPAAGPSSPAPALRQPARQHHPELDDRTDDRRRRDPADVQSQSERLSFTPPIGIGEIHAFEIFAGVLILFFLISFPLTRLAAYLEKRLI